MGVFFACVGSLASIVAWARFYLGASFFLQLAKGQMLGGADGFLKLIFDTSTLKLLGVHAFGEGATEIVHIGQVRGRKEIQQALSSRTQAGAKVKLLYSGSPRCVSPRSGTW